MLNCVDLFWGFVGEDCARRDCEGGGECVIKEMIKKKPFIRMQIKTGGDGCLCKVDHDKMINFPLSDPIDNTWPHVRVFEKDDVEVLEVMDNDVVYKVRIDGKLCALKVAEKMQLLKEIATLAKLRTHPSLPRLVGVVNSGHGQVDQFVTAFIAGKSLERIDSASAE